MQVIDNISNEARQKHAILLESNNSTIVLELTYKPSQYGWFLDVTYDDLDFKVCGLRVTSNVNLLNQWRNILPFGIACMGVDAADPLLIEDFLVGRATLSILSADEVQQIIEIEKDLA